MSAAGSAIMDVDHLVARVPSCMRTNELVAQLQEAVRQQCKCESQGRVAEVTHWGSSAFRKCRQLRVLGAQELACAFICSFFVGGGDLDHGLRLAT